MYINLLTDDYIPNEAIVREDANGLTFYENGSWRFLGKGEYDSYNSGTGISNQVSITTVSTTTDELIEAAKNEQTTEYRFYTNYFGLNSFLTANKSFASDSGCISTPIEVTPYTSIKLHADIQCDPSVASVEFSLVDGNQEIPILPVETKKVEHEKVFFMLPTRFHGTDKTYYLNGTAVGDSMDASVIAKNKNACTVSYTPDEDSFSVMTESDSVRIKVVFRIYNKMGKMPEVSNIHLEQEAEN